MTTISAVKRPLTGRVFETEKGNTATHSASGSLSTDHSVLIVTYVDVEGNTTEMKVCRTSSRSKRWTGDGSVNSYAPCMQVEMRSLAAAPKAGLKLKGNWIQPPEDDNPDEVALHAEMVWELWSVGEPDPFARSQRKASRRKRATAPRSVPKQTTRRKPKSR